MVDDFIPQTCDGWRGNRVKKTQGVHTKEIWCTINRNPIWNYVTKSRSLVPRPSSHYSLAICSLVVPTHCTVFGLVQVQKVIVCSVQQATKVTNPWYCKWYCQTLDSGKAWEWNQKSCSYTSVSHGRSTRLQLTHALATHACSVHAILPTHAVNYVVKLLVCFKWEMKSIGIRYNYTKWHFTPPFMWVVTAFSLPWRGNFVWGTYNFPSIIIKMSFCVTIYITKSIWSCLMNCWHGR